MKKLGFLLFVAAFACVFTGCRKTVELSFGVESLAFAPDGETREVELKSTGDWTVNDVPDWLSVSPMSGNGDATLTLVAQPNATDQSREGKVKASTKDVTATLKVSQDVMPDTPDPDDPDDPDNPDNPDPEPQHYLEVTPIELQIVYTGESKVLTLTCDETWTVAADVDWVALDKTEGDGDDEITVTVDENTLVQIRDAVVRFVSASNLIALVDIHQEAAPDPHFLEVTPTTLSFGNEGGSQDVAVACDLDWRIDGLPEWLTASTNGGTGNGSVTFTAAPNLYDEERMVRVSFISGDLLSRIVVTQEPGEEQYWLEVVPDTLFLGQVGGIRSFTITSNTSWTIQAPSWITYCSVTSGTGDAEVEIMADANNSLFDRTGNIAIVHNGTALANVVVVQEGIESILDPGVTEIPMPAEGGSCTFHLRANQDWNIRWDADWIICDPTEGSGNASVLVKAAPMNLAEPREAELFIRGSLGTVVTITVRQSN